RGVIGMQVIAAVVGRLSLAYEESAKSSYSDADGERRNKTNRLFQIGILTSLSWCTALAGTAAMELIANIFARAVIDPNWTALTKLECLQSDNFSYP
ncbi:MAG: hypothetical protein JWL65_1308, partial [Gammaproteobacteria bacterium]|nr:hypothetical protein [Gammaproteobacteria bacterium]